MKRSYLLTNASAYHGGVISMKVLETLSDERLLAMMHPFDRKCEEGGDDEYEEIE